MRIFAPIILSWFFLGCISAQDIPIPDLKRNAISIEFDYALFALDYVVNYERTIKSNLDNTKLTNLRLGLGRHLFGHLGGGEKGLGCKISLNPLIGNGTSFFESNFGIGVAYLTYCEYSDGCPSNWRFWPIVNIGYRYQSEFIFRIYIGSLGVGIGLGGNF
jgi:hypothetical protein